MKVLMLNGSPRKEGCTYTALIQIAGVLEKNGIESEIFQAGTPELEILFIPPDANRFFQLLEYGTRQHSG